MPSFKLKRYWHSSLYRILMFKLLIIVSMRYSVYICLIQKTLCIFKQMIHHFFFASKIYFFFLSIAYNIVYILYHNIFFLFRFYFFRTVPRCSTLYFKVQKQTRANLPYLSMLFTDYQVTWTFHQSLSWILNRADL